MAEKQNELQGKIISILPKETGTTNGNDWKKTPVIIETLGQYPKKIKIDFWKDLADIVRTYNLGDKITAQINIESVEFKEKWYTNIKGWSLNKLENSQSNSQQATPAQISQIETPEVMPEEEDQLPF